MPRKDPNKEEDEQMHKAILNIEKVVKQYNEGVITPAECIDKIAVYAYDWEHE